EAIQKGVAETVLRYEPGEHSVGIAADGRLAYSSNGALHLVAADGHDSILPGAGMLFAFGSGARLATVDGKRISLWDTGSLAAPLATLATGAPLTALAFGKDDRLLIGAGFDHVLRVWDLASGAERVLGLVPEDCEAIAVSPDGTTVAGACEAYVLHL